MITGILIVSITLQVLAAFFALRLIQLTRAWFAWNLIALGILLMALRRSISLYHVLSGGAVAAPGLMTELVALVISLMMAVGLYLLLPAIRERLMDREELDRKSIHINSIMENMVEGVSLVDGDLNVVAYNRQAAELLGLPDDFMAKNPNYEAVIRYNAERGEYGDVDVEEMVRERVAMAKQFKPHLFERVRPNGQVIEVLGNPMPGGGFVSTYTDITRRKEVEAALSRFKITLDSTLDCVFMFNPESLRFFYVNRGAMEQVGYSEEEMMRMTPVDIKPEFTEAQFRELLKPLQDKTLDAMHFQTVHRTRDGRDIPVEISMQYIELEGGDPRFVAIVRDIAERLRIETQMRESQKMEAVGQLAGGIAHDFNNILQIVRANVETAQIDGEISPKVEERMEHILRATDKAAELTRQLLTFGRRSPMHPRPMDLNQAVRGMVPMISRGIGSHIRVHLHLEEGLPAVEADVGMLEQVLLNLCVNARDALKDGGDIIIKTHTVLATEAFCQRTGFGAPGLAAVLGVSDNGPGIPEELRERIFEPFFTTKPAEGGSGLGLAMVYGIVQQHHGVIEVRSDPGQGAEFSITLPISARAPEQAAPTRPAPSPGGKECLLVVEDNAEVRELLVETLDLRGYKVYSAQDGKQALEVYGAHRAEIDLVLLDMVMPELSGEKVYARIQEMDPGKTVLFMTGYASDTVDNVFFSTNNVPVIFKPYTHDELLREIRRLLD